jgi:hypothetical protein
MEAIRRARGTGTKKRNRVPGRTTAEWKQLRLAENRQKVRAYLLAHPCADCGEADPDVLDFHHVGPKTAGVSALARWANWERVAAEIAQCVVLCANDHRRRHARARVRRRP